MENENNEKIENTEVAHDEPPYEVPTSLPPLNVIVNESITVTLTTEEQQKFLDSLTNSKCCRGDDADGECQCE